MSETEQSKEAPIVEGVTRIHGHAVARYRIVREGSDGFLVELFDFDFAASEVARAPELNGAIALLVQGVAEAFFSLGQRTAKVRVDDSLRDDVIDRRARLTQLGSNTTGCPTCQRVDEHHRCECIGRQCTFVASFEVSADDLCLACGWSRAKHFLGQ